MTSVLEEVVRRTLNGFAERLSLFMPNLLAMAVILVVGVLAAGVLRFAVRMALPRLGFDNFAGSSGLTTVLQKGGIVASPSNVVALTLAWAVVAVFVLLAIGALNLDFAVDLVARAFLYLPQLLIAFAVLLLGGLFAGFVRRSVLIAAVNAELPSARLLAAAAQGAVLVLVAAIALEHLGVGRQVILTSFTILFGGVVLAMALAFGFAGRDLARDLLERIVARPSAARMPPDDPMRHL